VAYCRNVILPHITRQTLVCIICVSTTVSRITYTPCAMNEPAKMSKCRRAPYGWHQHGQPRKTCHHGTDHLPTTHAHGPEGISQHTSGAMYGRCRLGRQESTAQTVIHVAITYRQTDDRGRIGHHGLCRLGARGGRSYSCQACQTMQCDFIDKARCHISGDGCGWLVGKLHPPKSGWQSERGTDSMPMLKLTDVTTRRKSSAHQDHTIHQESTS